jgi:hypothetical protein
LSDQVFSIHRITDPWHQRDDLRKAVAPVSAQLPDDELYEESVFLGNLERHLAGDFGPQRDSGAWVCYLFIAKCGGDVVGVWLAHDDRGRNLTFVDYVAIDTPPEASLSGADIGQAIYDAFLTTFRQEGWKGRPIRLLVEVEHPRFSPDRRRRIEAVARLRVFERWGKTHSQTYHCMNLDYERAGVGLDRPTKPLLVCYGLDAPRRSVSRAEAGELLRWIYLQCYAADCVGTSEECNRYRATVVALCERIISRLPEQIELSNSRAFTAWRENGSGGVSPPEPPEA